MRIATKALETTPDGPEGSPVQLRAASWPDDEQHVVVPTYFQPGRYVILVGNEQDFGGW